MDSNIEQFIEIKTELIIDTLNLPESDSKFINKVLTEIYDTGYQQGEADANW